MSRPSRRVVPVIRISLALAVVVASYAQEPVPPEPTAFPLGVAVGDVTDTTALAWTQSTADAEIRLEVAASADFAPPLTFAATAVTDAASDGAVKLEITGLTPETRYYYRFVASDNSTSRIGRFQTLAAQTDAAPLSFVFSGDTNYAYAPFTVAGDMAAENADMFIWFGDTIYGDAPSGGLGVAETLTDYWAKYRQIRSDPGIRAALANMALITGGDDHEVKNDYAGGDPRLNPAQESAGFEAFFDYMPIRPQPESGEPYRVYRRFRAGRNVEIFVLDGRQYRGASAKEVCGSNPDPYGFILGPITRRGDCVNELEDPNRSMLGAAQFEWLTTGLRDSTAAVKFVVNNVPLSMLGPYPYDRWDGYDGERRRLLEFIDQNAIDGVVFLTTDIHANAYNPDVLAYFRTRRSDYLLPGNVAVPEIIAGPLGNATFHQSVIGAGARLGRFGPGLAGVAERVLTSRVRRVDGLEFIDTNQVSYVRVDVSSEGQIDISYRGKRPGAAGDSSAFYDGPVTLTPGSAMPCALPVFGLAAAALALGSRRRRSSRHGAVTVRSDE